MLKLVTEGGSRTVWMGCVTRGGNPLCIRKPCKTLHHRRPPWTDRLESINPLLGLLGEPRGDIDGPDDVQKYKHESPPVLGRLCPDFVA